MLRPEGLPFISSEAWLQNKMIYFTTYVFRGEREKKSPLENVSAFTENNPDTKLKNLCVLWTHSRAAGEMTAHDKLPQHHYFCRSVNSDFLLVQLDQICPAASTGTDGESLVLVGGPELVAGGLFQQSHIRGCCAILSNVGCTIWCQDYFFIEGLWCFLALMFVCCCCCF